MLKTDVNKGNETVVRDEGSRSHSHQKTQLVANDITHGARGYGCAPEAQRTELPSQWRCIASTDEDNTYMWITPNIIYYIMHVHNIVR